MTQKERTDALWQQLMPLGFDKVSDNTVSYHFEIELQEPDAGRLECHLDFFLPTYVDGIHLHLWFGEGGQARLSQWMERVTLSRSTLIDAKEFDSYCSIKDFKKNNTSIVRALQHVLNNWIWHPSIACHDPKRLQGARSVDLTHPLFTIPGFDEYLADSYNSIFKDVMKDRFMGFRGNPATLESLNKYKRVAQNMASLTNSFDVANVIFHNHINRTLDELERYLRQNPLIFEKKELRL